MAHAYHLLSHACRRIACLTCSYLPTLGHADNPRSTTDGRCDQRHDGDPGTSGSESAQSTKCSPLSPATAAAFWRADPGVGPDWITCDASALGMLHLVLPHWEVAKLFVSAYVCVCNMCSRPQSLHNHQHSK